MSMVKDSFLINLRLSILNSSFFSGGMYHSNIKILDLSHNNISIIYPGYFRPAEISLTHLHLGYNSLMVGNQIKVTSKGY